jgi:hypothetical protein
MSSTDSIIAATTAVFNATPGTLFRIYKKDSTAHYTAVLLKDGSVLEVKNPDTSNKKEKFASVALWREARGAD